MAKSKRPPYHKAILNQYLYALYDSRNDDTLIAVGLLSELEDMGITNNQVWQAYARKTHVIYKGIHCNVYRWKLTREDIENE